MAIYISNKNEDGKQYAFVSGYVTQDAKLGHTPQANTPKVSFSVCYAPKKYMNCIALGDRQTTQIAARLEYGDTVFCGGTFSSKKYTSKEGTEKQWNEILCDSIFIQMLPQELEQESGFIEDDEDMDAPF